MAKFFGEVGFGESMEVRDGVWQDGITERKYFGDVLNVTRRLEDGEKVNNDLTVTNSISIVADAYANEHIFAIRYVKWAGVLWTVSTVEVKSPRLTLWLGGVYNGPTPAASGTP